MQPPRPLHADRRALLPVPAALPVLLEPARHRRRDVPRRARDRGLGPRLPRGARRSACFSSRSPAASRCCAGTWPSCARGARDAGLYSSLITAGTLFTRERARGAEGRRARPRPDLDPEPATPTDNDRIAGNRSFEKKIEAARLAQRARLPADDQLRPAPAEPRPDRGDPRARARARRAAARARQHAVLRLGGPQPGRR